jgi:hypothetical protein
MVPAAAARLQHSPRRHASSLGAAAAGCLWQARLAVARPQAAARRRVKRGAGLAADRAEIKKGRRVRLD